MSDHAFEDLAHLDPGGLWRCETCGGLVEELGCYVCGWCIGFKKATA